MTTQRKNLILLVGSVCLGLMLAEVIARGSLSLDYQRERYYRTNTSLHINPEVAVFDPLLGFRFRPDVDAVFETSAFSTSVQTNSRGYCDDESSLTNPDFLILGDSFSAGWGVEGAERVCSRFEKISNKKVLNLAVPGYNTIQEALLIEQEFPFLNAEDPVVLLMVHDNDLVDNSTPLYSPFPTLRKKGPRLIVTAPIEECYRTALKQQTPNLIRFLRGHSVVADLAGLFIDSGTPPIFPDALAPIDISFEEYGASPPGTESFEYAMRYLQMLLRERNLPLYAFYIPHVDELTGRKKPHSPVFVWVMKQLGITYHDFSKDLEAGDYYLVDGHWKASGHSKAAHAMVKFLENEGVLGYMEEPIRSTTVAVKNRKTTRVITPTE